MTSMYIQTLESMITEEQTNCSIEEQAIARRDIEWMLSILKAEGVDIRFECVPDGTLHPWLGRHFPRTKRITFNSALVMMPVRMRETVVHEFVHYCQYNYGEFKAVVQGTAIIIPTLGKKRYDYDYYRAYVTNGWANSYGDSFEELWLDEVPAIVLQTQFELFKTWLECEMT